MPKITEAKFITLFFLLCCFALANAAKGPQYRSLRVHGMGGAFVAVADGKDALYYNPAGLNLKSRFENFEKYPDMGYMPRQRYELRLLTTSVMLPEKEIDYITDICGAPKLGAMMKKLLFLNFGYFSDVAFCPIYTDIIPDNGKDWPDSLGNNLELSEKLRRLDRLPLEMGLQFSFFEFSMQNFGFATWMNTSAAPYIDLGAIIPSFGYKAVQVDAVAQTAIAFSPVEDWHVGVGLKAATRNKAEGFSYLPYLDLSDINNPDVSNTEDMDSVGTYWSNYLSNVDFIEDLKFGFDFGVLYQLNREVRLGSSLRNIFFGELAGEPITPNLSIGAAYSPMMLQSNSWWARKVNFAADYVDMLDGHRLDMFLSHINFGAEAEQVVLPSPTRDLPFWHRAGFGALGGGLGLAAGYLMGGYSGLIIGSLVGLNIGIGGDALRASLGVGFEGGYSAWNIGVAIGDALTMRFGSYAEERGVRTGQKEQRFWTWETSIGF